MMKFAEIYKGFIAFVYPKKCVCCKELIEENEDLCEKCKKNIERVGEKICLWCGHEQKYCECKFHVFRFRQIISPFINTGLAKQGFYDFKFRNRKANSYFFSKEMSNLVLKYYSNVKFDAVCPVPMHYFRKAKRGYNQSEILADEISRIIGVKTDKSIIFSKKKKVQHEIKGISMRYSNIKGKYYYKRKTNYENVLLVDDIKTTGATLDECARQLMLAGVNNVYCVTALISNPWLKKSQSKGIIKNKSGDKNGN